MFRMTVEEVFVIRGRGAVATGRVEYGELTVGDQVRINGGPAVRVDAIEVLRKKVARAGVGENIGMLLSTIETGDLAAGDVITSSGEFRI